MKASATDAPSKTGKRVPFSGIVIVILICLGIAWGIWYRANLRKDFDAAVHLLESGEYTKAIPVFERTQKDFLNRSRSIESRFYLAQCWERVDAKQALDLWNTIAADESMLQYHATAHYHVAKLQERAGNDEAAMNTYRTIISTYGNSEWVDDAYFALGTLLKKGGVNNALDARKMFHTVIERYTQSELISQAVREFGDLNMQLLFSRIKTPISSEYKVQQGDTLTTIAKTFNTTTDLLMESNGITNANIHPGDRLKLNTAVFSLLIDKSQNIMILKADDKLFKMYAVGTGKYNNSPVGEFTIVNKLVNPVWYKPEGGVVPFGHPENILGTRWMGIGNEEYPRGFGIHGTWEPDSIGKQSSAGCIRLLNRDVEELFKILPVETQVTIVD